MAFAGVALLVEGSRSHPIEVRLVRKWHPRLKSMDTFYIFVDKQGDAVQGFSAGKDQMAVEAKLQNHSCYHIKGYACTGLEKNTKFIPNTVGIRMGPATTIEHVADIPGIPRNYFCFGDFNDIREMSLGMEKVIDYIGVLEAIEHGKTRKSSKPYVNLKITDSSNEMVFITLWEEIATVFERFPRVSIQQATKPTVISATSLRFNQYSGRLNLQSTTATHVYLNPDHPAKDQLLQDYNPNLIQDGGQLTLFSSNAERITVSELLLKEHSMPTEKVFTCEAFIAEILTTDGWFYTGCLKCNGTAHKSDDSWFCTDCGDTKDIKYKSRIVVLISDGLSHLKVAMFDDTLSVLLEKPLHDIIAHDGYDDNTCVPEPIKKICGDKKFFILKPQREQYTNTPRFIVKQILPLDFFSKPLLLEPASLDTPPPPTPHATQSETNTPDSQSSTKKRLLFETEATPSPISDTKQIRYKE